MNYRIVIIFLLFQLNSPAFGEGIIDQIKDVILTSEQILSDTFSKLLTQAQSMENIKDIVNAAIEENCTFKCSNGQFLKIIHLYINLLNNPYFRQ